MIMVFKFLKNSIWLAFNFLKLNDCTFMALNDELRFVPSYDGGTFLANAIFLIFALITQLQNHTMPMTMPMNDNTFPKNKIIIFIQNELYFFLNKHLYLLPCAMFVHKKNKYTN